MMTSKSGNWETPQELFDKLNKEFCFDLDAAASDSNKKCEHYFTQDDDALLQEWNGRVFCNPPYGINLRKWIAKGYKESVVFKHAETVVMLVPARTDTIWFHTYVWGIAEVRFLKGRLRFCGENGVKHNAPFPSMIVIWRANEERSEEDD